MLIHLTIPSLLEMGRTRWMRWWGSFRESLSAGQQRQGRVVHQHHRYWTAYWVVAATVKLRLVVESGRVGVLM